MLPDRLPGFVCLRAINRDGEKTWKMLVRVADVVCLTDVPRRFDNEGRTAWIVRAVSREPQWPPRVEVLLRNGEEFCLAPESDDVARLLDAIIAQASPAPAEPARSALSALHADGPIARRP